MFVATLLTDPRKPALDPALVENLRNAWGGGDAQWLSPDEAVEFALPAIPENRWQVWEQLQGLKVDLVVQPSSDRRKRLLLADMDSTMIQQECIDELAEVAGIGPRVAAITRRAMNGELNFEEALVERVGLLKGLETPVIDTVLREQITLMPGGRQLIATMKSNGAYCVLVSGGFTAFTAAIAEKLGFDEHHANTLLHKDGKLTGQVEMPILGRAAKVDTLQRVAADHAIPMTQTIAVGDGANDLGMLHLAGAGVALHAKPSVAAECDIRVNHGDLTALLFLQGYARSEFVTC